MKKKLPNIISYSPLTACNNQRLSDRLGLATYYISTLGFLLSSSLCVKGASCGGALIDYKVASGDYNKLGTAQNDCATNTPKKYYLVSKHVLSGSDPGSITFNFTDTETVDPSTATRIGSGTCNWYASATGVTSGFITWTVNPNTYHATWDPVAGGWTSTDLPGFSCWGELLLTDHNALGCNASLFVWVGAGNFTTTTNTCTQDHSEMDASDSNGDSYTDKTDLSSEFDDAAMRAKLIANMSAYPSDWSSGDGGSAGYSMGTDHFCANGSKMQYRVKMPDSEKNATYLVAWQEETTTVTVVGTTSVTASTYSNKSETIAGTGDPVNPAVGKIHEVPMPSVSGSMISITIQEVGPNVERVISVSNPGD
jgi:hypothetical protein